MKKSTLLLFFILTYLFSFSQTFFPPEGGSGQMSTSYAFGQVTCGAGWVTLGKSNNLITWKVSKNTNQYGRNTYITGSEKASTGNYVGFYINISQAGAGSQPPTSPPKSPCQNFQISGPSSLRLDGGPFEYVYQVYRGVPSSSATYSWSISGGPVTNVTGQNTNTLHFTADNNTVTSNRITITLYSSDGCTATFNVEAYP